MATQPPHGVGQAITAIWISLAVSALSALAGKLMGLSTQDEFITSLIAYAIHRPGRQFPEVRGTSSSLSTRTQRLSRFGGIPASRAAWASYVRQRAQMDTTFLLAEGGDGQSARHPPLKTLPSLFGTAPLMYPS